MGTVGEPGGGSEVTGASPPDLIALLVSRTRVRAALCSREAGRWRTLNAWLSHGQVTGDALTADAPGTTVRLTGMLALTRRGVTGEITLADGTRYPFRAEVVATTNSYQTQGERRGVYLSRGGALPDGRRVSLYVLVRDVRISQNAGQELCAMVIADQGQGAAASRVRVEGVWQEGFSLFTLLDIADGAGTPLVWNTPRPMQRIEAILLPASQAEGRE
jgi:hypothetical protein